MVLGSHEFGLPIWLGAQGGSQISTRREDFAGGSAVLPTLSKGLEIELSDFEAENATLKGNYLWQVIEIGIGSVPTDLVVCFRCLIMSLDRMLLRGSRSMNLFDLMSHAVDDWHVSVGILLLQNIYLGADIIPPGNHFVLHLGWCPTFSIDFCIYLSLLHKFRSRCIGFGLPLFAVSAKSEHTFDGVITKRGVLYEAQCCITMRFILSTNIECQQGLCGLHCVIEYGTMSGAAAT